MKWHKKGLIIEPQGHLGWMKTHAMIPVADHLREDIYRVYFSGRDCENRSLIGYGDINIVNPIESVYYSENPVLGLGELGCFDDNGVTPSWIVNCDDKKFLYYIGWNPRSTVRMKLFAGLAISYDDGISFKRFSRVSILDRTHEEPFLNTAPCVIKDNGIWRMWYVSGVEWVNPDLPRYNIKYAESKDGKKWQRNGIVCIDFKKGENALARPSVLKESGKYKMWYSYKGGHYDTYRIGYAESNDGIEWERQDNRVGIDVSNSGWDSEMIEYSYVFNHKNDKYMLYNGNEYGRNGIGLAVMEEG
jgi:hypothetical protein